MQTDRRRDGDSQLCACFMRRVFLCQLHSTICSFRLKPLFSSSWNSPLLYLTAGNGMHLIPANVALSTCCPVSYSTLDDITLHGESILGSDDDLMTHHLVSWLSHKPDVAVVRYSLLSVNGITMLCFLGTLYFTREDGFMISHCSVLYTEYSVHLVLCIFWINELIFTKLDAKSMSLEAVTLLYIFIS